MSTSRRKVVLPIVVLLAGVLAFVVLVRTRPEARREAPPVVPPHVRVLEVAPQDVAATIPSQGTVEPRTETRLVAEVPGRVVELAPHLVAGGFCEAGEVLVRLDDRDYALAVVRARAALAQAEVRVAREEAEAEVAREEWRELGSGTSPGPLTDRSLQVKEARAALEAAQAALDEAELALERTRIRAPYAGRVRSRAVDLGQFVVVGQPVAQVYAIDAVEVRLPVPSEELAFLVLPPPVPAAATDAVSPLAPPRVTLRGRYAGREVAWEGRIVRSEAAIDPRTRMAHLVARVEDPYGVQQPRQAPLEVGLFVDATIHGRMLHDVFAVPRTALRDAGTLLIVDDDDRLRFRRVHVARTQGDLALVDAGLEPGERVCLSPLSLVTDGMPVAVEPGASRPGTPATTDIPAGGAHPMGSETPAAEGTP